MHDCQNKTAATEDRAQEISLAEQRRHSALHHAVDVIGGAEDAEDVIDAARTFEAYLDGGAEKSRIAALERAVMQQNKLAVGLRDDLQRAVRLAESARARVNIEVKLDTSGYLVRGLSHFIGGPTAFRCDKRVPYGQLGLADAVMSVERELAGVSAQASAAQRAMGFAPFRL